MSYPMQQDPPGWKHGEKVIVVGSGPRYGVGLDRAIGDTPVKDVIIEFDTEQACAAWLRWWRAPQVTVNGDGECTQVEHKGEVVWKMNKPTAPALRRRIEVLTALIVEHNVKMLAGCNAERARGNGCDVVRDGICIDCPRNNLIDIPVPPPVKEKASG